MTFSQDNRHGRYTVIHINVAQKRQRPLLKLHLTRQVPVCPLPWHPYHPSQLPKLCSRHKLLRSPRYTLPGGSLQALTNAPYPFIQLEQICQPVTLQRDTAVLATCTPNARSASKLKRTLESADRLVEQRPIPVGPIAPELPAVPFQVPIRDSKETFRAQDGKARRREAAPAVEV